MISILITLYTVFALLFFLVWRKRIDFRQYYSTLLMMSYLRFLEQYIIIYMLKVWEYKHLPLPFSKVVGVPMTLDLTIYPLLAYLFILFVPDKPIMTLIYYFIYPFTLLIIEVSLVWQGFLEHQNGWNFIFSYYVAFCTFLVVHWQYRLFLKTGWYSIKTDKTSA